MARPGRAGPVGQQGRDCPARAQSRQKRAGLAAATSPVRRPASSHAASSLRRAAVDAKRRRAWRVARCAPRAGQTDLDTRGSTRARGAHSAGDALGSGLTRGALPRDTPRRTPTHAMLSHHRSQRVIGINTFANRPSENHRDALLPDGAGATRSTRLARHAIDTGLSGHTRGASWARPRLELLDKLLVLTAPPSACMLSATGNSIADILGQIFL